MKRLVLLLLFAGTAIAQRVPQPTSSCPVLVSLASSKVHSDLGDSIVIFFWNQGKKTIHGAQFTLLMLDVGGSKYPASQRYLVTGDLKSNSGDVVVYPTTDEEKHFGENWKNIDGVEV